MFNLKLNLRVSRQTPEHAPTPHKAIFKNRNIRLSRRSRGCGYEDNAENPCSVRRKGIHEMWMAGEEPVDGVWIRMRIQNAEKVFHR